MDIQAEKIELVKMLLNTEDEILINEIRSLFNNHEEEDFFTTLPAHVIKGIEESRQQADKGWVISLDDVIRKLNSN